MPVLDLRELQKINKRYKVNAERQMRFWQMLNNAGRIGANPQIRLGPYTNLIDCWKNQPCIVIGSGPSLKDFDFTRLKNIKKIGINHLIEDYDNLDWLVFLDQRFPSLVKYDLKRFTGKIFAQNNCFIPEALLPKTIFYKCRHKNSGPIDLDINKGLYTGTLSALVALHLALISGANPIYLIGIDCGGTTNWKDYHFKPTYTGALHKPDKLQKYKNTAGYFKAFLPWKHRIINLSPISEIKSFQKKNIDDIAIFNKGKKIIEAEKKEEIEVIEKIPTICHVIAMPNMVNMGSISRFVYEKSWGNHIFCNINSPMPHADIYLLECFINQSGKFLNFQRPHPNAKIISIIHSSSSCIPAIHSDKVIVLTNAWQKMTPKFKCNVIEAGVDMSLYKHEIDYNQKVFGRITRVSPGKYFSKSNEIYRNILNQIPDSKCYLFADKNNRLLQHERCIIDTSIKIHEEKKKALMLSKLTLFADMHNTFIETFSLCLLEAMASGLACVMFSNSPQPSMREILGNAGIWCKTPDQFQNIIIKLLSDAEAKKELGMKARERAKNYSVEKMIEKYNKIFKEVLN